MALLKEIKNIDGIPTKYHRILFLMQTTNKQNSIAVISYFDEQSRNDEKNNVIDTPYKTGVTYELPYDPNMTIESAYEYLKTLPQFEGAEDI